jgi:1-deoxy-D-xylulose-5-phosphate reductoisomerase
LAEIAQLTFEQPDLEAFPCLKLAYHAAEVAGDAPAVLNAANEIAVDAFLNQRLGFTDIAKVVEQTLNTFDFFEPDTLAAVQESDARARRTALLMVKQLEL